MAKHIGIDKILIPYATNRKAVSQIEVAPVDICVTGEQYPVPCKVTKVLTRRPKVAVVPYTAVTTTTVVTVTRRKTVETTSPKFGVRL